MTDTQILQNHKHPIVEVLCEKKKKHVLSIDGSYLHMLSQFLLYLFVFLNNKSSKNALLSNEHMQIGKLKLDTFLKDVPIRRL